MAIETLNVGTGPGTGDGDGLRSAQIKVNSNFAVSENAASKIVQASSADTTADKVMMSDYAWRSAQLGDYFTYGGTANAITLTSANLKAGGTLIAGMKFRFKATAANTGATTIAVDGGAAITCLTVYGAALNSGYISTANETIAFYDGANFRVLPALDSIFSSTNYQPDTAAGIGVVRLMKNVSGAAISQGETVGAAALNRVYFNSSGTLTATSSGVVGTWKAVTGGAAANETTEFVRIS